MHQVCNVSALRADVLSARFFKVYFKSFEASWEEKKNSLILSFKVSGFCCTGRHLHEGELALSKGSFSELGCAHAYMSTCVGDIWELFPQQSIIHQGVRTEHRAELGCLSSKSREDKGFKQLLEFSTES